MAIDLFVGFHIDDLDGRVVSIEVILKAKPILRSLYFYFFPHFVFILLF